MNKYAPKKINKDEAQSLYDSGISLRGLTKHYACSPQTIRKLGLNTRTIADAMKLNPIKISPEKISKLSDLAKLRGLGGYRPHPNKGLWYKDIWFDSAWEVKVAKSLDESSVEWTRPKIGFVWTDSGRKYYPDFYLPGYDVYLDPKNSYLVKKDAEKIFEAQKRNSIRVLLLSESQLSWDVISTLL